MAEYDDTPSDAPGKSGPWLKKIKAAEKAFEVYQEKATNIEKLSANLEKLAKNSGDKEFQIFWANLEVLKPAIYTRPPRPVVMPRHSDLGEVIRKAAEMMERALVYDVEADDLHDTLLHVRDDLATCSRGVPWVLDNGQAIHIDRRDFLHEPARKWKEVTWAARAVYVTKEDGVERFGEVFRGVEVNKIGQKDDGEYFETEEKAKVWEIWCKESKRVYYVVEGVETILEENDPFIDVKDFFPCPQPAYGTLQPGSLLPVPDFVYYRDQVDEINTLTRRISSLTESLRMKGFYASGASEIGEAIESAMKQTSDKAILVPIANFAALGGVNLKESIVWLPIREVGELIASLVQLRKQLIEDVYEITGLSDIMRGSTQASETATAQNLKAQFGSVRVQTRQAEMVRIAVDILRIKAEIYAETVPVQEIAQMAAMQMPTMADVQAQQMALAQQDPQAAQAMELPVTLEQVGQVFTAERIRPFLLNVESDSTIAANEEAEKKGRIEFLTAIGSFMQQAGPAIAAQPEIAPFMGELMKFTAGGFRAGRDLGGAVDDFVEQIKAKAKQATEAQGQPNPETVKAQADAQMEQAKLQMDAQVKQAELQIKSREVDIKEREVALKERDVDLSEREVVAAETDVARLESLEQEVAMSKQQMAQAVTALTQQMAQIMDTVTAPRRIVRNPDGSAAGVEIMSQTPITRGVARDENGNMVGVDRLQ